MAKEKVISIRAIDKIFKESFEDTIVVDWHGEELAIKKILSIGDVALFVSNVVDVCFHGSDGEYTPEFMDYAIRYNLITAYTNVRLPEDINHQNKILYATDLVQTVMSEINKDQYKNIIAAINEKVDSIVYTNEMSFMSKVNAVSDQLENITDLLKGMVDGIGEDDIQKLVSAISDNKIDEEKLVNAVIASQAKEEKADVAK